MIMKAPLWRDYDVPQEKIEQLRTKIFEYCAANPNTVEVEDVKNRILSPDDVQNNNVDANNNKTTDWMLKRFLISAHKDADAAFQKFIEFFTFRKQFNVASMTVENVFPSEFFQIHPFDCGGFDKNGNRCFTVRLKYYRKMPQFENFIKRGIVYFSEQMDLEYEQGAGLLCDGVCLILDAQDFGVTNLDMDMLQFIVKHTPTFYSGLVRCCLIYETPFLLSYLFKVVEGWLPSSTDKDGNKRKFFHAVTKKNIHEWIDADQRPDFLNGSREVSKAVPPTSLPFEQFVLNVNGMEEQNVKKIKEYLDQLISTLSPSS